MGTLLEPEYKNILGKKLTNRLGRAIRAGEIQIEEVDRVIPMLLSLIDSMQYKEEVQNLFTKLSSAWPFFSEILQENTQSPVIHT